MKTFISYEGEGEYKSKRGKKKRERKKIERERKEMESQYLASYYTSPATVCHHLET